VSGPPADARRVKLDATGADMEDPATVGRQIPDPATLHGGTAVVVEAIAARKRGLLQRVLGDKRIPVSRSVRCTALLARGYVDIAADGDATWGTVRS
jgi:hypothetical protein